MIQRKAINVIMVLVQPILETAQQLMIHIDMFIAILPVISLKDIQIETKVQTLRDMMQATTILSNQVVTTGLLVG